MKNRLSQVLEEVQNGERIGVTRRGRVIAYLIPARESPRAEKCAEMVREGLASWDGGTPQGIPELVNRKGSPLSEIILEDRS